MQTPTQINWSLTSESMTNDFFKQGDTLHCVQICPTEIQADKYYVLQLDNLNLDIVRKVEDRGDSFYFYSTNPKHQAENFTIHKDVISEIFDRVYLVTSIGRMM